jgi:hypothetical protein
VTLARTIILGVAAIPIVVLSTFMVFALLTAAGIYGAAYRGDPFLIFGTVLAYNLFLALALFTGGLAMVALRAAAMSVLRGRFVAFVTGLSVMIGALPAILYTIAERPEVVSISNASVHLPLAFATLMGLTLTLVGRMAQLGH